MDLNEKRLVLATETVVNRNQKEPETRNRFPLCVSVPQRPTTEQVCCVTH